MADSIETVIRQHRFALELVIARYELDSGMMLRFLKNLAKDLQELGGCQEDRKHDEADKSESG